MSHYAEIVDGTVHRVIVADDDVIAHIPGEWVQTSYNTAGGEHATGGTPMRGNYAATGYIYDAENDVFYPPQPYPSWTICAPAWVWQPPVPRPETGYVTWDEETKNWVSAS
jgi:hypothetical protein